MPNLVASGLFGDGAAAVVAVGGSGRETPDDDGGPSVIASRSRLYPDSERTMGWDVGSTGLKIVLDAAVPGPGASATSGTTSTASSPTTG